MSAFASDGVEYAAWQIGRNSPIVALNTLTDHRRSFTPPAGCVLGDGAKFAGTTITAAAGRFLLSCAEAEELLDVKTGHVFALPSGQVRPWYIVGTRYVVRERAVYDIATRTASKRSRYVDPDAPGASLHTLCPKVRSTLENYTPPAREEYYAFTSTLLVRPFQAHGDVQLDHCHGRPTILKSDKPEAVAFDLRGGLLTWDTGTAASGPRNHRGTLYAYDLSTHTRQHWLLPLEFGVEENVTGEKGTFGYSTHTANTVFWIADADATEGSVARVDRWIIFAAKR